MRFSAERIATRLQFAAYGGYAKFFSTKEVAHHGTRFTLGTSTANEAHRGFTFSNKEPETLAWIDRFPTNAVFYDVGANVGIYSLYAGKKWPSGRVYAFEPDSQSFAALCRNIHLNRRNGSNIFPYQFAITDRSHVGTLQVSRMQAGVGASALGSEYKFVDTEQGNIFQQGVAAFSLDDLVKKHGFPMPSYLKVDVDGLEQQILHGSDEVLRAIGGLLVEFQYRHTDDLLPALSFLEDRGLHVAELSQWEAKWKDLKSRNYIFQRK